MELDDARREAHAQRRADLDWARAQTSAVEKVRPTLIAEQIIAFEASGVVLSDETRVIYNGAWFTNGKGRREGPIVSWDRLGGDVGLVNFVMREHNSHNDALRDERS